MLHKMLILTCLLGFGIGLLGAGTGCVYHDRDHWWHDDHGWHRYDDDHHDHDHDHDHDYDDHH